MSLLQLLVTIADMVRSCSALGCTNRDSEASRSKGIKFYRFPKNEEKRKLWLKALEREDFDPSESAAICSIHFVGGMHYNYISYHH